MQPPINVFEQRYGSTLQLHHSFVHVWKRGRAGALLRGLWARLALFLRSHSHLLLGALLLEQANVSLAIAVYFDVDTARLRGHSFSEDGGANCSKILGSEKAEKAFNRLPLETPQDKTKGRPFSLSQYVDKCVGKTLTRCSGADRCFQHRLLQGNGAQNETRRVPWRFLWVSQRLLGVPRKSECCFSHVYQCRPLGFTKKNHSGYLWRWHVSSHPGFASCRCRDTVHITEAVAKGPRVV